MESTELTVMKTQLLNGPNNKLRRRNSIATCQLTISTSAAATSSSSSSSSDFDLVSVIKPQHLSYTSLKDLISGGGSSGAVNSPTAATPAGSEISIRNRLVKQAAWAYLQPMSTSSDSPSKNSLVLFVCSLGRALVRALDWLLRPVRACLL